MVFSTTAGFSGYSIWLFFTFLALTNVGKVELTTGSIDFTSSTGADAASYVVSYFASSTRADAASCVVSVLVSLSPDSD